VARRNTKKTVRGSATLAALALLLVAAPVLAEDSESQVEAQPCQQVERVAGASCPIPGAAEPTGEAEDRVAHVAMGEVEIPIYYPPNRGNTASRVSGSVRGLERPGPRL
jgi:hypothetical protein